MLDAYRVTAPLVYSVGEVKKYLKVHLQTGHMDTVPKPVAQLDPERYELFALKVFK